jgi:hypothetical protein
VIATLRDQFVNAWLLAKDLDRIANDSGDAEVGELCELIRKSYDYPVDSILISPDLEVVGHVNVNEPAATDPRGYLAFLQKALARVNGEPAAAAGWHEPEHAADHGAAHPTRRALRLSPEQPAGTLLDLVQKRRMGQPSMTFFVIDATAFPKGGTLEIAVQVGSSAAAGKFELCASQRGNPSAMAPVETLAAVKPGESGRLVHEFAAGAMFGLAAMPGPESVEGDANAFLATVTVRAR